MFPNVMYLASLQPFQINILYCKTPTAFHIPFFFLSYLESEGPNYKPTDINGMLRKLFI